MAKRKRKKETKQKFEHSAELYGVLFILMAILGIGKYGPVGRIIASFSLFLVGSLYMPLLVVLFVVGAFLIIKREWPDFFTTKLLGTYIAVLGFLILMHKEFVIQNDGNMMVIFQETVNQLVAGFNSIMNSGSIKDIFAVGGGIVGGTFAILFDKLFSIVGMEIIAWAMVILGMLLFTGFSIVDIIRDKYEESKEARREKKEEKIKARIEKEKIKNNKVIISDGTEVKEDKKVISDISEVTNPRQEERVVETKPVVIENDDNYILPDPDKVLNKVMKKGSSLDNESIEKNIIKLEEVLSDFGISGKVVEVHVGPSVTQYELEIKSGTKVSKILNINREIALGLAKKDVRIEAPIPGKKTVGIEFANDKSSPVSFYEIIKSKTMENNKNKHLMVPLGKSIMGDVAVCEINKMPHLLIAGTTGSGKSVCVNGIICSILMRAKPSEVKLMMVDPKVVELSVYNGVPHLLAPVITDPNQANIALKKMVQEMENRYTTFSQSKTKNIESYNEYVDNYNKHNPNDKKQRMPYIVIVIDELSDLMMVAAKDVEASILRITQKARAAGMHLIVATQRPSTEVITGLIKANIPSRIAFAVGSGIDSRTILDQVGAEKLLGKGDMLYMPIGTISPTRIQGSFITDKEIANIIDFVSKQKVDVEYHEELLNLDSEPEKPSGGVAGTNKDVDPIYNEVVEFVVSTGKASASLLQRKFSLGYNRAARIIDELEENGIIGPQNGSKPREVLVKMEQNIDE